ncbi:CLUMA_CG001701, isoform A [Clunio marinus]|uniref:CLUMA_CG001701, isoform A n=1 Tax=Clunio marinus TaxID=568069 RepID=A0A1J1HK39_9DIPT|nr:CLUMA_CG001701, isoform A [Clunio marinus]
MHFVINLKTRVACSVSGKGTCVDPFCYLTPINETTNAINIGCGNVTRPLNKIFIRQKFYFKLFSDYLAFDFFPDIEYCSFYKRADRNSFFYYILKTMKSKAPDFIHRCPYEGKDLQVKNLILGASDIALWITGEYKVVYTFFDDEDEKILRVSAMGILKRN